MNLPAGFTRDATDTQPLHCVQREAYAGWRQLQAPPVGQWLDAQTFQAGAGTLNLLPGEAGIGGAVLGVDDPLDPLAYAHAPMLLPPGRWRAPEDMDPAHRQALVLGWGLGSYRFARYRKPPREPAQLLLDDADPQATLDLLAACLRVRELVNTPTEHMGPDEMEACVRAIAKAHGGEVEVVAGDALLEGNYPAIHAVGRASHRAPRLLAMHWGDTGDPHVAIVGKGVCFDTGGLNLKASAGMRNMKKDMGGAAHAIALAELLMRSGLKLRGTLLVPAVENAVGPNALRPGEVIATRTGLSVEIDNTDAEGRLVLCDALARAAELQPDLLLDFATLTGAARIALGPDLPALYSNDDGLANAWLEAGRNVRDPLWRMPLWQPYLRYLNSPIADIANASNSSMAGSVTAALYLQKFVPPAQPWAHVDVYAWNDADRPGCPAGGEAQGLRAAFAMLAARYGG